MTQNDSARWAYATGMAAYISMHPDYDHWTKDDAVREVINVMATDMGAAQGFLDILGLKIDLYTTELETDNGSESDNDHGTQPSDAGGEIHGRQGRLGRHAATWIPSGDRLR